MTALQYIINAIERNPDLALKILDDFLGILKSNPNLIVDIVKAMKDIKE